VKRTNIVAALLVTLTLISTGCGSSDYVQSIQVSATGPGTADFSNLSGADGTLQLNAIAIYHSGKNVPITNSVTYTVTTVGVQSNGDPSSPDGEPLPAFNSVPAPITISPTGLMTATSSMCTWVDLPSGTPPVLPTPPQYNWLYTGYYQIVAVYNGMSSQPIAIGVGSAAGNAPDGSCGPS
jgi:hypothetical protein